MTAFSDQLSQETRARTLFVHRHRLARSTTNIAAGPAAPVVVPVFETEGYSRITGVCKSDVAVTVRVLQGSGLDDADMEYKSDFTVAASATEGAGTGFSVEIVAEKAKIAVIGGAGATTDFMFAAYLRSGT